HRAPGCIDRRAEPCFLERANADAPEREDVAASPVILRSLDDCRFDASPLEKHLEKKPAEPGADDENPHDVTNAQEERRIRFVRFNVERTRSRGGSSLSDNVADGSSAHDGARIALISARFMPRRDMGTASFSQ